MPFRSPKRFDNDRGFSACEARAPRRSLFFKPALDQQFRQGSSAKFAKSQRALDKRRQFLEPIFQPISARAMAFPFQLSSSRGPVFRRPPRLLVDRRRQLRVRFGSGGGLAVDLRRH